jgi:hypothetical protein
VDLALRRLIRWLAGVLIVALLGLAVTLIVYVASEDTYLADGTSRWVARAGDTEARALFWLSIALAVVALPTLTAAAARGRLRWALTGTLVGTLAAGSIALAFMAFTAS